MRKEITLNEAYYKGRSSGSSAVDADVALERFISKYQTTKAHEHAWWNGFEDVPYGKPHATHCPRGVAHSDGHSECER
jgi:hypothetical protein